MHLKTKEIIVLAKDVGVLLVVQSTVLVHAKVYVLIFALVLVGIHVENCVRIIAHGHVSPIVDLDVHSSARIIVPVVRINVKVVVMDRVNL